MEDTGDRAPAPPTVAADLDGWRLADEYVERVFEVGAVGVEGHTAVYDDPTVAADGPWRFFFATRLVFDPPLVPGLGTASVYPTVATESAREFAADLRSRGFERVERGRRERTRTAGGDRLRLTRYTATYRPAGAEGDRPFDVEAWLGLWTHDGEFRLAGGAYPTSGLSAFAEASADPAVFRDELLALIRSVD